MEKVIRFIIVVLLCCSCFSCKKNLKAVEYAEFIRNKKNGLVKITELDGYEFTMQYRPYDYIILMESKGDFSGYDLNKRSADLKGTAWFSIVIRRTDNRITPLKSGLSSLEEYNMRLNYFLNEAKNDIWLLYDNITIQPTSYLFENNYNLTPELTMLAGFILPSGEDYPRKNMQLSYNDQVFKSGIIKAAFSEGALNEIPNLVYKN